MKIGQMVHQGETTRYTQSNTATHTTRWSHKPTILQFYAKP